MSDHAMIPRGSACRKLWCVIGPGGAFSDRRPSHWASWRERAAHEHFANICLIGDWLIDEVAAFDDWPSIGAEQLQPIYLEICTPPALPIEIALRLQNLYAAAFFAHYLRGADGYYGYLQEAYAETYEGPAIEFFGNVGPPIPALPSPFHYAALAVGLTISGGFLLITTRSRARPTWRA